MSQADAPSAFYRALQDRICDALEALDGGARFGTDPWTRPGGGGGVTRVLEGGALFEKAGVAWSDVQGELPADFAAGLPGKVPAFRATGVSLVLHPATPMVPTVHANFRFLEQGDACWFGGGADLTPYYPFHEDVLHFHRTWKEVCDRHDPGHYPRFKAWCDEYFFLGHRGETRGVGGIFFDYLRAEGEAFERVFRFVREAGESFLPAYVPIARRRREEPFGERERDFQLWRRGRYVEFNLIHDRGTLFGLKSGGRTESILMSLPPLVRWSYDRKVDPGSREARLFDYLRPRDWLGEEIP